jgi:hypothetical protein
MVWYAVSSAGTVKPIFLDNTVNAEFYLTETSSRKLCSDSSRHGSEYRRNISEEGKARPHSVNVVLHFSSNHSQDKSCVYSMC